MSFLSHRACAAALLALAVTATAGADEKSWVGQTVLLKRGGVTYSRHKDDGKTAFEETLTAISYPVLREEGTWVRVRQRGAEGWLLKANAVLLDEAVDYFGARLKEDRKADWAYAYRGWAHKLQGKPDAAEKDYDEAVRLNAGNASWFYNRGLVRHEKKDYDKAIADYDEAIRLDPARAAVYLDRGLAWDLKEEHDKAILDYDQVIRLDPNCALAFNNRGWSWHQQNEYAKALKDYDEAIRLDSKCTLAFTNRAWAWKQKKEYGKAIKDYDEAMRLDPASQVASNSLAWMLATCPEAKCRDGKRAAAAARKLCAAGEWKVPQHVVTLAAACAEEGDFEGAVRWQKKALEFPAYAREQGETGRKLLGLYEGHKPFRDE